jgi:hypothetical protein
MTKNKNLSHPPSTSKFTIHQGSKNAAPSAHSPAVQRPPRMSAVTRFHNTDAGNAELIAALFGTGLRYDHRRGRWLLWQDHWWADDTDGTVQRLAKTAARWRAQAASGLKDPDEQFKWAFKSEARERLLAALEQRHVGGSIVTRGCAHCPASSG